jgi:myosin protein heavy chain
MAASELFRASEVRFLQEQNKQILSQLQVLEEERDRAREVVDEWEAKQKKIAKDYDALERKVEQSEADLDKAKGDTHNKDEQVRVLSEQNRQLLDLTEAEDQSLKRETVRNEGLKDEDARLVKVSKEYDSMEQYTQQQVMYAQSEVAKMTDEKESAMNEQQQLKTAAANYQAQARADLAALETALGDSKKKNVEYLQTIQRAEVQGHRYEEDLQALRKQVEKLQQRKSQLQSELDGEEDARDQFHRQKVEMERKLVNLEKTADKLKKSMLIAEDANQNIQDESRTNGEKYRQMADKVYSLMDSLRLNQMEVKKQQRDGENKVKKLLELEKTLQAKQIKVQQEADHRAQAETDARTAQQMMTLLKKKNRKLEETQILAQKAQEKAAKKLQELEDNAKALQTQNTYLASRVDGQEEDKAALKAEIKSQNAQLEDTMRANAELSEKERVMTDEVDTLTTDKAGLAAELDYIRREDMLDETGRTKPVLIQSKESKLVEKLHINEFLYRAQQSKNPIPMLIEKLSHLLELLHTASTQADVYLQDLNRSNGLVSALRQKNLVLFEKAQLYDSFKTKAQLKYITNSFQSDDPNLYLDGLNYSSKELSECLRLIYMYNVAEKVTKVSLQDNSITDEMIPLVMQIVFSCAYLQVLDLRKNHLTAEGVAKVQEQVAQIEGITKVEGPPALDEIRASSGNQLRMKVYVAQQTVAPDTGVRALKLDENLNAGDADEFLAEAGGFVGASTASTMKPPQLGTSMEASQTQSMPMLNADASQPTLPKLDLSRGAPKGAPRPPGAGHSHRSYGSGGSRH